MSGEPAVNVAGLTAYPSKVARWMPAVKGHCPSCGLKSLFLAVGGHVTCANLECRDPLAIERLLGDQP